jgi:hypothetical protein
MMARLEDTAYGQRISELGITPPPAPARSTPGSFRAAEDISNETGPIVAPEYTPSALTDTGEFIEEPAKVATATVVSTYTDPNTGDIVALYSDGTNKVLSKGTKGLDAQNTIAANLAAKKATGQSAYDALSIQFNQYGLGSLITPLKDLIIRGAGEAEMTMALRESEAYQKRFAANKQRIANGFKAIDEATYLGLEDKYQSIMQNYGLPASYYTRGEAGVQPGFEKFIAGNVDPVTLEERIMQGVKINQGSQTLIDTAKQFYPNLTDGDFLAYTLDPKNALSDIKRKVTAIEIGGAATQSGLQTNVARAEELGRYGVNQATAEKGYSTIGSGLQRGSQLAAIYQEDPYTQTTAEQEIFNIPGAQEARKARQKITGLEKAAFGGQTGITSGALARDRAGGY